MEPPGGATRNHVAATRNQVGATRNHVAATRNQVGARWNRRIAVRLRYQPTLRWQARAKLAEDVFHDGRCAPAATSVLACGKEGP